MPESRFLAMGQRVPFQAEPTPLKQWLAVDEVLLEPGVKGFQIGIPIAVVVVEQDQRWQPDPTPMNGIGALQIIFR